MRAQLLYEQWKGRPHVDPLLERLMLLVHIRLMKIRLMETEIIGVAGINEHNRKRLGEMLDAYRDLMFPGADEKKLDKWEELAQKQLAEEAKKVYLVRRQGQEVLDSKSSVQAALQSENPTVRTWAAKVTKDEQRAQQELRRRFIRRRGNLPKDAIRLDEPTGAADE